MVHTVQAISLTATHRIWWLAGRPSIHQQRSTFDASSHTFLMGRYHSVVTCKLSSRGSGSLHNAQQQQPSINAEQQRTTGFHLSEVGCMNAFCRTQFVLYRLRLCHFVIVSTCLQGASNVSPIARCLHMRSSFLFLSACQLHKRVQTLLPDKQAQALPTCCERKTSYPITRL
jgi:hypothetical protein